MGVAYANAYKGGLAGHTINLVICENQDTPAGGQACANQLVQDKVVAVVLPFTGQGATEVRMITKGIPPIALSGALSQEAKQRWAPPTLTGGYPGYTFRVRSERQGERGFQKFAMLVGNVPSAILC